MMTFEALNAIAPIVTFERDTSGGGNNGKLAYPVTSIIGVAQTSGYPTKLFLHGHPNDPVSVKGTHEEVSSQIDAARSDFRFELRQIFGN